MAATDTFDQFIRNLPDPVRKQLDPDIAARREALFAARSEDARLRVVSDFITDARALQMKHKR